MAHEPSPIRILSDSLINKIAAGEVVERPASVVKELLENALDAGAARVDVAIEEGGRKLIRVSDDGSGIPPDQAALAFAQHATSKIASAEDLFAIRTMGFRGEALASIAGVSHVTLTTRTAQHEQGIRLEVHASAAGPATPCAAKVGTTLEVRDLFYSVPARRKFLRADATEFGHIHEMLLRSALAHPAVAFLLTHNDRLVQELAQTTDWRSRISAALGPELHDQLLPIAFEERGVRITGFAGTPALARGTAKYQYIFLNGRYIRDRSLFHALKEAYRGLIEPTSQPLAVLFLTMDPTAFDVNVHPQKIEVRFRDANAAYSCVLAAVRERLLAEDLTPGMKVPAHPNALPTNPPDAPPAAGETRRLVADFLRSAAPTQSRLDLTSPPLPTTSAADSWHVPPAAPSPATTPSPHAGTEPADRVPVEEMVNRKSQIANDPGTRHAATDRAMTRTADTLRFAQLHNTYIVVEDGDAILIIDQHALHERILYEELFARVTRGPLEGQRLLLPEPVPVNPRQQAVVETVRPLLAELGIEIADFDAHSIAVHTFPSLLARVEPREFVREILDKIGEMAHGVTREEMLHEVLDMASCKAAVKAGYPLADDEIRALLARRDSVERSSNCPHGRPTTLRLSRPDLERQFKRK